MPSQPRPRVHHAPSGRLHLEQLEGARGGPEHEPAIALGELAGAWTLGPRQGSRTPHAQPLAAREGQPGADVRVKGADLPGQAGGAPGGVEPAIVAIDLLCVGGSLLGLVPDASPPAPTASTGRAGRGRRR